MQAEHTVGITLWGGNFLEVDKAILASQGIARPWESPDKSGSMVLVSSGKPAAPDVKVDLS